MNSTFYKLLDNTMAEVCRREPSYISSFPIALSHDRVAQRYTQQPACSALPPDTVEQALVEGLGYFREKWSAAMEPSTAADPMVEFLCDCIIDAACADQGLLSLQPHNGFGGSVAELFRSQYCERRTQAGISYYVRDRGSRPLLLINATGTPIAIWSQFLFDPAHDFKIIVPQRRGTDLFRGRLLQHADIETESADLGSILDAESLDCVDILAWCNGARVAIDLVNSRAHQMSALVLLGPMLKGIRGVKAQPSNFERDLQPLLDAVRKESSLAPLLSKTISKQPTSPDWARLANDPGRRSQALFAMPAKDHADAMTAMLTDPQSFINIARRVASDESYPMDGALGKLQPRTMVIMGSDDSIVSNELVSLAMQQMCQNSISQVVIRGSGHYVQDLQYHYFRWLLTEFLENRQPPRTTTRISAENLAPISGGNGCG